MMEVRPDLSWRDVQYILMRTAYTPNNPINKYDNPTDEAWITNGVGFKFNNYYGAGVVNASKAVLWSKNYWYPLLPSAFKIRKQIFSNSVNIPNSLYTEHVVLEITNFVLGPKIVLISPLGTRSELSPQYPVGFISGFKEQFKILTNVFWGENSQGIWQLEITRNNDNELSTSVFNLNINGVYNMPIELINLLNITNINKNFPMPPLPPPLNRDLCTNTCWWNLDQT